MRWLFALVILVGLAVAAATIANHPGAVAITWQGWEVETSVGVVVAALAIAALLLWLLFALVTTLLRLPGRVRRNRRERRRRAGDAALTRGFVALASGDGSAAQRYARRAGALLERSPPTLMLAAQAAQLAGDAAEAKRFYTAMLDRPRVELLGLRGLLGQALRDGDEEAALRLAERARTLQPKALWAFEALLALQTRAGQWEAARDTVAAAMRRHLLAVERANHHRGVILHQLSLAAEHAGDADRAVSLAASAAGLAVDLAVPSCRYARLLMAQGKRRRARHAIERAWSRAPHPGLALAWSEIGDHSEPLAAVGWAQRLAALHPTARDSELCVAEAALAAQLWGEARACLVRVVTAAGPEGPSRRVCLLMARLEAGEYPQTGRAREWVDRAVAAPPDPAYICSRCGGVSGEWLPLCPYCRSFDTLRWREHPAPALDVAAAAVVPLLEPDPPPSAAKFLAPVVQSDK
jgi:HemY protein